MFVKCNLFWLQGIYGKFQNLYKILIAFSVDQEKQLYLGNCHCTNFFDVETIQTFISRNSQNYVRFDNIVDHFDSLKKAEEEPTLLLLDDLRQTWHDFEIETARPIGNII